MVPPECYPIEKACYASTGDCKGLESMRRKKGFGKPHKLLTEGQHDSTFKNALLFHRQGELEKAKKIYEQVLIENPNHFNALHHLALVFYQFAYFDNAEHFF